MRLLTLEATPLQGTRARYVCSGCRQETRPRPLVARQFLRNASSDDSTTEKVRRKLWGTDNPPGMKDPYGGEGQIEKHFRKGQASKQGEQKDAAAEEAAEEAAKEEEEEDLDFTSDDYEPASTWKGLDRIGHLGKWTDLPRKERDTFTSYVVPFLLRISSLGTVC